MYINLQLALFSALAVSAWIYARSDFLCSLEVENANLEPDGRVFTFFSRYSRENTLIFFASKCQKVQNCQKRCNYAHVEENRSKSRNLSNEHLFVFFRGCRYISLFKIGQSSTFAKLSRRCLSIWFSPSFRPAFASWVLAFAGTTQFKPSKALYIRVLNVGFFVSWSLLRFKVSLGLWMLIELIETYLMIEAFEGLPRQWRYFFEFRWFEVCLSIAEFFLMPHTVCIPAWYQVSRGTSLNRDHNKDNWRLCSTRLLNTQPTSIEKFGFEEKIWAEVYRNA